MLLISDMFLSREDLRVLTGYQRPSCMIRWLRENDFIFTVAADGYPRVLIDHVKGRLTANYRTKRSEPNLAALGRKL
ncbi:MAG: DUF4224 domain-containing protein [Gammaproteobacteria bacterium]